MAAAEAGPGSLQEAAASGAELAAVGRFAGQGHRYIGELRALYERSAAVQELVDTVSSDLRDAAERLGRQPVDPLEVMESERQDEAVIEPSLSCPLICLTQLATVWMAVDEIGLGGLSQLRSALSRGLCGHSQGIVSAVAVASAGSRAELASAISVAVVLLWLLGVHAESVEGGMLLLEGPGLVRSILNFGISNIGGLHVAGRNQANTFVLSGTKEAVDQFRAQHEAKQLQGLEGTTVRRLRIAAPFHSPLLAGVVPGVVEDAARLGLEFGPPRMPVMSPGGYRLDAASSTIRRLVETICSEEMNWPAAMSAAGRHSHIVEFGPGAPLPLASAARLRPLAAPPSEALAPAPGDAAREQQEAAVVARAGARLSATEVRGRVLHSLARTIGCSESELDLHTPFFDLGLRSNDLARFAGALAVALDGAPVAAHELFDYPTAAQLSDRVVALLAIQEAAVQRARPSGGGPSSGPDPSDVLGCIVWEVAAAMEWDTEDVEDDMRFAHLGMSDEDLETMAKGLSAKLHLAVDAGELQDFPTPRQLADHLQRRLAGFANFGPAWALFEPKGAGLLRQVSETESDEERQLDLTAVLQMQKLLRKRLAQADVQSELRDIATRCFPDGEAYLAELQAVVMDEEERIYRSIGFINTDPRELRRRALRLTTENIKTTPKLRAHSNQLVSLTWPADSHRWRW